MSSIDTFPKHILLCGTFDRQMASFARSVKKKHQTVIGALSTVRYDSIAVDKWKLGNLTTDGESDSLLDPFEAAVWFCLTPFERKEKKAGNTRDITMMAAIQFVRAVKKAKEHGRNMRVILVIRAFPNDCRTLGEIYDFWWQIYKLFKKECPNLCIIRTAPEISKDDAVNMALYELASCTRQRPGYDGSDTSWLNLTSPITRGVLNSEIEAALVHDKSGTEHIVQGGRIISYDEWFAQICSEMPKLYACVSTRIRTTTNPEMRMRRMLLKETIKFHSMNETEHENIENDRRYINAISDFVEDMTDGRKISRKLLLPPIREEENTNHYYVRHIADAPHRPLIKTAELLTYWLPLYFRRSLNLEEINDRRVICKLSHIPLFEIERRDSGDFLCQLFLRWPWKHHMETRIGITLATTPGDEEKPGLLLIACENCPDNIVWQTLFSRITSTFGKFIREYS